MRSTFTVPLSPALPPPAAGDAGRPQQQDQSQAHEGDAAQHAGQQRRRDELQEAGRGGVHLHPCDSVSIITVKQ